MGRWLIIILLLSLPATALSDPLRIATYNASLNRSGPGLLLRAIEKNKDAQIKNVIGIIQHIRPDILLINEIDWDVENRAAKAFISALNSGDAPIHYPHFFTSEPNSGRLSGFDLNNDGKVGGPNDAFGYGKFPGQYGMLLLSRFEINAPDARTFAKMLWRDLPGASLPTHADGAPFPSTDAQSVMRLSSKSHWDVPVNTPNGPLHIYASHPTPPVFDGPEDRNGLTTPESEGAKQAATKGPANKRHQTDPAQDTADWNDQRGPGNLRVDYALPTKDINVKGAGVFWPAPYDPLHKLLGSGKSLSSDHRLVWLDIDW